MCPVCEFIVNFQLHEACEMVVEGAELVAEVAASCGVIHRWWLPNKKNFILRYKTPAPSPTLNIIISRRSSSIIAEPRRDAKPSPEAIRWEL